MKVNVMDLIIYFSVGILLGAILFVNVQECDKKTYKDGIIAGRNQVPVVLTNKTVVTNYVNRKINETSNTN